MALHTVNPLENILQIEIFRGYADPYTLDPLGVPKHYELLLC